MPFPSFARAYLRAHSCRRFLSLLLSAAVDVARRRPIRGVVTDVIRRQGYRRNCWSCAATDSVVASAVSSGRRQLSNPNRYRGRFFLVVSAKSFRQLETPDFYAGRLDNIERNVVLEPEWVRESIVVTATGTPTPQSANQAQPPPFLARSILICATIL